MYFKFDEIESIHESNYFIFRNLYGPLRFPFCFYIYAFTFAYHVHEMKTYFHYSIKICSTRYMHVVFAYRSMDIIYLKLEISISMMDMFIYFFKYARTFYKLGGDYAYAHI